MTHRIGLVWLSFCALTLAASPALAAFHLMEIEQVIGGVGGDASAQAVQLKMRSIGQNFLSGSAQLVVRDAAGANPVILSTFPATVITGGACREILIATAGFSAKTTPAAVANFTMLPIPASYLPAGSLTFEGVLPPTIYWRVSWGNGSYSGSQTVALGVPPTANDSDGTTSPAFTSALPSTGAQALRFTPPCSTDSTNSLAQYAVTAGAATFTNNALTNFTVLAPPAVPLLPGTAKLLLPVILGLGLAAFAYRRRQRS